MGIEDFYDFFNDTVTLEPLVSRDGYGTPVYGAAVAYPCRVQAALHQVVDAQGTQRTSTAMIYLAGTPDIEPTDRITLPSGFVPQQPPILVVGRYTDEDGAHHTRITC
jgi:hypothetical protein